MPSLQSFHLRFRNFLVFAPPLAPYAAFFDFQTPLMRAARSACGYSSYGPEHGAPSPVSFLNAWVLTNRRITTIKQRRFFNREVSSLLLPRIQDVTTNVTGVLPSLLGIGDIKVQSAGEMSSSPCAAFRTLNRCVI